jgi:hypothetical protein
LNNSGFRSRLLKWCSRGAIHHERFDEALCRVGRSALVEGDDRTCADRDRDPAGRSSGTQRPRAWCRSFLFTVDGKQGTRFPAATPLTPFRALGQICVGELMLKVTGQNRCWIAASLICTGGRFPAISIISGERRSWESHSTWLGTEAAGEGQRAGGSAAPSENPCLSEGRRGPPV